MNHLKRLLFLTSAFFVVVPALANEYSPAGFYEVEEVRLENGLRVLLKQRGEARAASLRLVVGVGTQHMSCEEAELPHLVEHVVFEGTEAFPEPGELDRYVETRGGYTNATTGQHTTVYEAEIYGPETPAAVEVLYEMAHEALMEEAAVEGEKATVHRELGSDASAFRRWLYARGIGQSAGGKALEVLGHECAGMERADDFTRERLVEFYRNHYVSGNMTLLVVGRFDQDAVLQHIRETFGTMPDNPAPDPEPRTLPRLTGPLTVTGTLAPLLGSEASVGMVFPTGGHLSEDFPALVVIDEYLHSRLFDRLRREAVLSYGPGSDVSAGPDYGYFYVGADAARGRVDEAAELLREELAILARDGMDRETVDETIQSMMLRYAQGSETNSEMADYYVESMAELDAMGEFVNYEDRIAAVTPEQIREVAARVLRPENSITVIDTPTFSYGGGLLFGGLAFGVVVGGVGVLRRRRGIRRL